MALAIPVSIQNIREEFAIPLLAILPSFSNDSMPEYIRGRCRYTQDRFIRTQALNLGLQSFHSACQGFFVSTRFETFVLVVNILHDKNSQIVSSRLEWAVPWQPFSFMEYVRTFLHAFMMMGGYSFAMISSLNNHHQQGTSC